jgi:hypothetical protein
MRYRPSVRFRGGRFHSRLNMSGFGATSVAEILTDFETAEEALADLMLRLRQIFRFGDRVDVGATAYRDLDQVEVALRAAIARDLAEAEERGSGRVRVAEIVEALKAKNSA